MERRGKGSKKKEIVEALIANDNNRSQTAISLGLCRSGLYKWFSKFPEINFEKEYPPDPHKPPPPLSSEKASARSKRGWQTMKKNGTLPFGGKSNTPEANAKRGATLKKRAEVRREKQFLDLIPKIRKALSKNNNSRQKA